MNKTAPVPSAASSFAADQEVRFGVVMFGGVSLAIYMNGISQEMLRMVRATAPDGAGLLLSDSELDGTERVYRRLGQILCHGRKPGDAAPSSPHSAVRTRFVIDILSGTSAGGINAIFLAKALANNQTLETLTRTWQVQADIGTLLNDKGSEPGKYPTDTPKRSLLNSRRMYGLLVNALRAMNGSADGPPLAQEIDLFVTATDLNGIISPISLADEVIEERVHKADFHFVYSPVRAGTPNDFAPGYDEMLAFAARCTSSFPLAFEPMRPADANHVVPGFTGKIESDKADVYRQFFLQFEDGGLLQPVQRSLADGGYLQNKPFSFTIDAIRFRTADLPVARKLIYVDPFPEQLDRAGQVRFDFVENTLLAASTLPRYQTIRQDLEHLAAYNRGIQKARSLMEEIEESEEFRDNRCASRADETDYPFRTLKSMLTQRGICYLGYHRMRVSSVTWDLAVLVSRLFGFRDDAAGVLAIRSLLCCWRTDVYHPEGAAKREGGGSRPTENRFLTEFDFGYRMRRIDHLRGRIDNILAALRSENHADLIPGSNRVPMPPRGAALPWLQSFRAQVVAARRELVIGRERLWLLYQGQPLDPELKAARRQLAEIILASGLNRRHLEWVLRPVSEDAIQARADDLYDPTGRNVTELRMPDSKGRLSHISPPGRVREAFTQAAEELSSRLREPFSIASRLVLTALASDASLTEGLDGLRGFLRSEYDNFDCRDVYLFAAVQDHLTGEGVPVEVYRISPLETRLKIGSSPDGSDKLAGGAVMAFAGFLSREWRDNDILWGRLDGADRLIRSLLPEEADGELCQSLVEEATEAILDEDFRLKGCDGLLGRLAEFVRAELGKHGQKMTAQEALKQLIDSNFNPRIMIPIVAAIRKNASLTAVFEAIYQKPGPPPVETQVEYIRRSLAVFSSMLQGLDDYPSVLKSTGQYIGLVGAFCSRFVEFSLGGSLLHELFRRWLLWLYSAEIVLILAGLIYAPVKMAGWIAFGITVLVHGGSSLIGRWLGRPDRRRLGTAAAAIIFVLLLALSLGFFLRFHFSVEVNPWLRSVFPLLRP